MNMNSKIFLNLPPVGIKILSESLKGYEDIPMFNGISYCQAIFRATFGSELLITPGTVKVCQWAPVVLGFKEAENAFEQSIDIHLTPVTPGIYIAPLHLFKKDEVPDVVIIRAEPDVMRQFVEILGLENFINPGGYALAHTALGHLTTEPPKGLSGWLIRNINSLLDMLNRYNWWQRLTTILFKSTIITRIFDKFITRYMANMSMCRNSTVMPFQKGKANVSYFCTGGIAWGKNSSGNMTSGYPYKMFQELNQRLDYPGKIPDDKRLQELEKERKRLIAMNENIMGCRNPE